MLALKIFKGTPDPDCDVRKLLEITLNFGRFLPFQIL